MSFEELVQWLEDSDRISLTKWSKDGQHSQFVGWRFHFEGVREGFRCVDETNQVYHGLSCNVLECGTDGKTKCWTHYKLVTLVYERR